MISYQGQISRLRPVKRADIAKTVQWRNNPELRENVLGYRFPVTEEMEQNWFDSVLEDSSRARVVFAIESLLDGELLGLIYLNEIDWIARHCYFGIVIGEQEYHGKGYASDSMETLFAYAFDCLNLRKICLQVAAFNTSAIHLYHKFGFAEEGVLREQIYLESQYHDLKIMSLFVDQFKNYMANHRRSS